jgi:hypothetical protein
MKDPSLEQHLERVVHEHEHGIGPTLIPGTVEVLDAQNERVERLVLEKTRFFLHADTTLQLVIKNRRTIEGSVRSTTRVPVCARDQVAH